jgi:hypothetical protein
MRFSSSAASAVFAPRAAGYGPLLASVAGAALMGAALLWRPLAALQPPAPAASAVAAAAAAVVAAPPPTAPTTPALWTLLDASGHASTLRASRAALARRCALPLRDLRVLDASADAAALNGSSGAFGAAILCRQRAMVLHLRSGVRALLTRSEVLLPVAGCDARFVAALSERLRADDAATTLPSEHDAPAYAPASPPRALQLRVLEAALEHELCALTCESDALHAEAGPALDALLQRGAAGVTSGRLERVRRVRGGVARTRTAAAGLRAELLRFLDDDSDMRAIINLGGGTSDDEDSNAHGIVAPAAALPARAPIAQLLRRDDDDADVQEVEDLLETFFAAVDALAARLTVLDEGIDDAEAFVAADMDAARNGYIRLNLCLAAAAAAERAYAAAARAGGRAVADEETQALRVDAARQQNES